VSNSTLTSRINAARKAVGDSGESQKLIRTIARKGLRFVGVVSTQASDGEPSEMPVKLDSDREHYLEGFRRAGLD
jgi:DNA-binding winged helix-turn-helix (wHTH) protein